MERSARATRDYLREVGWALLLVNLFAGAAGTLVGAHMESVRLGLALFLGGSLSITMLLALMVAATLAWDAAARARERRPAATAAAGAAAPDSAFDPEEGAMSITLTSTAFAPGGSIPAQYTCDGRNASPPLAWSGLPEAARSLVLIVDDPDAPDPRAPQRTWVHWLVYDIPAAATSLAEGASREGLPPGAREGVNDWGRAGYGGPCPPIGRHRYFHKLFALDTMLASLDRPNKKQLEQVMAGHVLGHGQLVGTYQRRR